MLFLKTLMEFMPLKKCRNAIEKLRIEKINQIEPSFILLDQDFKDKSEALLNLVEILDEKGCLNNKQKYLESIIEREKISNT